DAANTIGSDSSPIIPTAANALAYESLVDLSTKLDEANIPDAGRWCVIPAWYEGLLLKDARFVSYGTVANRDTLLNGMVGRAAGFDILKSNNVTNSGTGASGDKYRLMAGTSMAISLAEQILNMEPYRPHLRFADALKGLHVWGCRVIRSQALAVLFAQRP